MKENNLQIELIKEEEEESDIKFSSVPKKTANVIDVKVKDKEENLTQNNKSTILENYFSTGQDFQ